MNDCQIDYGDHCSVRLNPEAVSPEVASYVVGMVVLMAAIETLDAEMAARMGQGFLHLNLHLPDSMLLIFLDTMIIIGKKVDMIN